MEKFSCKEMKYKLSAYLDGELTEDLNLGIEEHIAECSSCKEVFLQLKSAKESLNLLAKVSSLPEPTVDISERVSVRLPRYELGIFADPVMRKIAAGMAIILILFIGWLKFKPVSLGIFPADTLVTQIQGQAQTYKNNQWQELTPYSSLYPQQLLRTKKEAYLQIQLPDKKSGLFLKEDSILEVKDLSSQLEFNLIKGELFISVVKPFLAKELFILTPHVRIQIWGTLFKVLADGEKTKVEVLEGRVKLTPLSGKPSIILNKGEKIEIAHGQAVIKEKKPVIKKPSIILWREVK